MDQFLLLMYIMLGAVAGMLYAIKRVISLERKIIQLEKKIGRKLGVKKKR